MNESPLNNNDPMMSFIVIEGRLSIKYPLPTIERVEIPVVMNNKKVPKLVNGFDISVSGMEFNSSKP